jgi:hypothetical protein
MVLLDKKIEKAIMSSVFSRIEYNFITDLINSTKDTSAPVKAIKAYAMRQIEAGPIAENHTLKDHVSISASILNKLQNVTLTKYDIVDKD